MSVIITAILGLVSGAIGSLVAPWVQWGVEKRRRRFEQRKSLVESWRSLLHDVSEYTVTSEDEQQYTSFRELVYGHPAYYSLEPHLSDKTKNSIDSTGSYFWGSGHVEEAFKLLLNDINRIEKEWGLC